MALWRNGAFAENAWTTLADDAPAPASGAILVSLPRWRREKEALGERRGAVGVEIVAGKDALEHLPDAADRPLVALRFDKFADGRAFSYAILLRERYPQIAAGITAFDLNPAQQDELSGQLSKLAGAPVRLRFAVDTELIGGVTAKIASRVYDGSVRGQLTEMRKRLALGHQG